MEYVQRLLMRLFLILVIMLAVENGCNGCWEKERLALLQIKDSINFPNGTSLPSWEEDDYLDCCQWERVECHPITGRVIKLSLNHARDWVFELPTRDWLLYGHWYLNASVLLPFESLQSLDLSDNYLQGFIGDEGPGILSNLRNLEDLDLGYNELDNSILPSLNKLSNLRILNLTGNELTGSISIDELDGLKNLRELDLSYNRVVTANGLEILSNLEDLDLGRNELDNSILPSLNKLSNLKILNLAVNNLNGSISIDGLGILSNLRNLEDLDLGDNRLDNSILPSLNKLSNLKILNLAGNQLDGSISINELDGLKNLKELDLHDNSVSSIVTANELDGLKNLKELDLSSNRIVTANDDDYLDCCQWEHVECHPITDRVIKLSLNQTRDWVFELPTRDWLSLDFYWHLNASVLLPFESLRSLDWSGNGLRGFDGNEGLKMLSNLEDLDLRDNGLDNSILPSLNKLSNLKVLNLARNELNGSISIDEFDGLKNLKELDLSGNNFSSIITANGSQEQSRILNKLEVLDLSYNWLNDSVWSFVGELSSIKTLYLENNHIGGLYRAVPNLTNLGRIENLFMDGVNILDEFLGSIRFMTSIQVLSLRDCAFNGTLPITGLCELKTLRELDISAVGLIWDQKKTTGRFGGTLPWCLANLTSLRLLDITSNQFTGNIARSPLINLTSLEYLAISNNDFEIPISFKSFFNHSKLKFIESLNNTLLEEEDFLATFPSFQLIGLRLSNSEHGGITRSFPHFLYHQHDLQMVELSQIGFSGKFPKWLFDNNARMEALLLSGNSLGGPLLLPSHYMIKLLALDISNNHLEGFIPYKIGSSFPSLKFLNMSTNNFDGDIPSSLGDMTALTVLDLSNNRLSGVIPVHLAMDCRLLEFLKVSNNNLKGPILPSPNNLTQLQLLYSDNNGFTEIPPNLSLSSLSFLNVGFNQLVGKIPVMIGSMSLYALVMSANHLEGPIPMEFCQLKNLELLDLSENNITGGVPSCFNSSAINSIRLSKNRLHGPFPMQFQNLPLVELDLSYNQFSGNIPTWIGSLSNLKVLLLQNNHFEGNIPKELCHLSDLTLIDLSFNNLFGSIIPCIGNIEFNGIPEHRFSFGFGFYESRDLLRLLLSDLRTVLKGEEFQSDVWFSGTVPEEVEFETKGMSLTYKGTVLYLFSGINLSHNRLSGPIPHEIGNLSHIKVLNLSHNYLTGTIPATFSNLKSIESLDLSYNHLYGKIPSQLTELNFLAVFNLSYNNLSGRMPPRVNQFETFESYSYVGNPLLCGEPVPRNCNAAYSPPSTPRAAINDSEEDSCFMDMDVFYVSFAASYVAVVLTIVAVLFINPYWRREWFHLVEVFLTSSYHFVVDNLVCPVRGFLRK